MTDPTVTVFAGSLAKALDLASKASGPGALDILTQVKLEALPGEAPKLQASCTDLVWGIRTEANCITASEPFAVCVNATRIASLVRTFVPDAQVTLTLRDERLVVKCQASVTRFPVVDAGPFPLLPEMGHPFADAPASRWAKLSGLVGWAALGAGKDPASLTNVAVRTLTPDGAHPTLEAWAADGNCAAYWKGFTASHDVIVHHATEFLVPAGVLEKATDLVRGLEEQNVLGLLAGANRERPNGLMLCFRDAKDDQEPGAPYRSMVTIRFSEGVAPAIPNLLERIEAAPMTATGLAFAMEPGGLRSALSRTLLLGQVNADGYIPIDLRLQSGALFVACNGQQTGDGVDAVEVTDPALAKGDGNRYRVNSRYLAGMLRAAAAVGGVAGFRATATTAPLTMTPDADGNFVAMSAAMYVPGEQP